MKLKTIEKITGKIELLTGLHIGGGDAEMHIGGTDNPVIKNPLTQEPFIPGSSIKGKVRSMLEWHIGVVGETKGEPLSFESLEKLQNSNAKAEGKTLLKLFGGAPKPNTDRQLLNDVGPTRLAFWDCSLNKAWVAKMADANQLLTEVKMENSINRIAGTAEHPRNTERVPAGAIFDFTLSMRVHDGDDDALQDMVLRGLKLLELTGLGGSGSRGYGKIAIQLDNAEWQAKLDAYDLEQAA